MLNTSIDVAPLRRRSIFSAPSPRRVRCSTSASSGPPDWTWEDYFSELFAKRLGRSGPKARLNVRKAFGEAIRREMDGSSFYSPSVAEVDFSNAFSNYLSGLQGHMAQLVSF